MVPAFSTFNKVLGMFLWGLVILGVYFTNTWNTGYLPIISNRVFDHFGERYNVSRTLDERGLYDHAKYMDYSAAYLGAANAVLYGAFFGIYSAAITHVALFHRYEIAMGFKNLWASIRRRKRTEGVDGGDYKDVHNRLMAAYPEGKCLLVKLCGGDKPTKGKHSLRVVVFRRPATCFCFWFRRCCRLADVHYSRSGAIWCCSVVDLRGTCRDHQSHDRN